MLAKKLVADIEQAFHDQRNSHQRDEAIAASEHCLKEGRFGDANEIIDEDTRRTSQ